MSINNLEDLLLHDDEELFEIYSDEESDTRNRNMKKKLNSENDDSSKKLKRTHRYFQLKNEIEDCNISSTDLQKGAFIVCCSSNDLKFKTFCVAIPSLGRVFSWREGFSMNAKYYYNLLGYEEQDDEFFMKLENLLKSFNLYCFNEYVLKSYDKILDKIPILIPLKIEQSFANYFCYKNDDHKPYIVNCKPCEFHAYINCPKCLMINFFMQLNKEFEFNEFTLVDGNEF